MTVRCILIAIVILQLSNTVKCSAKVENGGEKQTFSHLNNEYLVSFPQTFTDDTSVDSKTRSFSDVSKVKETGADNKQGNFKRGCENSFCAFFKNHRVIRQAGYSPMYPQLPTSYPYRQPNNTNQYNTHQPSNQYGTNLYSSYSGPVVPIIPYQNPTTSRPVNNSSLPFIANHNTSYHNYQNSKHTYPPSPRPPNNQPYPSYRTNTTYVHFPTNATSRLYKNYPTNSFGNVSKPGYPNSYPRSNFTNYNDNRPQNGYQRIPNNIQPQYRPLPSGHFINNSRTNYNGFHTYPTSNFNKNFNGYQSPNASYYNGFNRTNYKPQTNFTYGTPAIPNYGNYAANNSYGSNKNNLHVPFGGSNYYPPNNNNFNQNPNNPYQWTTTNRPQAPYNPNIPQYNPAMEPNHFYYVPNNNGSQYDPRKHPPERFSY